MDRSGNAEIWNALAAYGLPLGEPEGFPVDEAGLEKLPGLVAAALRDLEASPNRAGSARRRESLAAFLLALSTSFPSRYEEWLGGSAAVSVLVGESPSGRVIKLKRIAERRLSEIL
jgi:hypothetical protein